MQVSAKSVALLASSVSVILTLLCPWRCPIAPPPPLRPRTLLFSCGCIGLLLCACDASLCVSCVKAWIHVTRQEATVRLKSAQAAAYRSRRLGTAAWKAWALHVVLRRWKASQTSRALACHCRRYGSVWVQDTESVTMRSGWTLGRICDLAVLWLRWPAVCLCPAIFVTLSAAAYAVVL